MTTSADQKGKMRKLPENSRARRRIFDEDVKDQAAVDNFANILQEFCRIDKDNMTKKWNFDFERELPLPGTYSWYRKENDQWIGMKPDPKSETELDNKFIPIEKENQMTPRVYTVEAPPVVRKRKRDGVLIEKGTKRKISFD